VTAGAGRSGARWLLGICIAVFTAVAIDVTKHGPVARVDPRIARWSYRHVTGASHDATHAVTQLGDAWLLTILVVLAIAWLVKAHRRLDAVLLASAGATVAVLTTALKDAFHRDRPIEVDPVHGPKSFSFPSGHASGAFAVYVLLAIMLTGGLTRRARSWIVAAALALATLVAASRVLLPVHFLSDVVAGTAVGLSVVASALLVRAAYGGRP
jgi:membrane-associated phospholipid phosphatase